MSNEFRVPVNRRMMLQGAIASAASLSPVAALAAPRERDMKAIRQAVEAGFASSLRHIQDWSRLPTHVAAPVDSEQSADYTAKLARDAGFNQVRKVATRGSPVLFGVLDAGAKRTVGLYFIYDVTQPETTERTSPPLEAQLFDHPLGRVIRGRGPINHKGAQVAFLAALHAFRAARMKLPVNLVLVADQEQMGSPDLTEAMQDEGVLREMQRADAIFMPACQQSASGEIVITLGAKGIIECELISSGERWGRGPVRDTHSGAKAYVDSPTWHLVEALSTLVRDGGNMPAIDGWLEHVRALTDPERALIAEHARAGNETQTKEAIGVKRWVNDISWVESIERSAGQPTVNIEGLMAGYAGVGGKTILPARATAKLDMRLVPNMTAKDCVTKLRAHLDKRGFGDIEMKMTASYDPTETAENSGLVRAERALLRRLGVAHTVLPRISGSYPGYIFTGDPLRKPFNQFGLGHGGRAQAQEEFYLVESTSPRVAGMREATMGYVELLYEMAGTP